MAVLQSVWCKGTVEVCSSLLILFRIVRFVLPPPVPVRPDSVTEKAIGRDA
jgi:hypothetical protein